MRVDVDVRVGETVLVKEGLNVGVAVGMLAKTCTLSMPQSACTLSPEKVSS